MRLFVAIGFDSDFRTVLDGVILELVGRVETGHFVRSENLHLTLAFLGEVGSDRLPELKSVLNGCSVSPFTLRLSHIGRFPGREGKDLMWIGIETQPLLVRLAEAIRHALPQAGFPCDPKPFSPHLTIGREIRFRREWEKVPFPKVPLAECVVSRFLLMESVRVEGELVYRPLFVKNL